MRYPENHLQHLFTFPVIVLGREATAFPAVMNGHPLAYMNACLEIISNPGASQLISSLMEFFMLLYALSCGKGQILSER